jgi:hypothetical protein
MNQDGDDRRGMIAVARWGVPGVAVASAGAATAAGWIAWPAVGVWLTRHAVFLVWVALIVVLVGGAVWRVLPRNVADPVINWARRGVALLRHQERRRGDHAIAGAPRPPLSWWMVAAAVAVVALVAWGATTGLLQVASTAKDPAAAQVEAIKTGLSIAAGTGGVFALLLAVRRQWHQEVSTAADATHKEQVAADTRTDAAARRITELYTKAADQLGSDKAPVRLAGLYALERLAQDNEGQRATIVQVLCAYLRMPYTPPEDAPGPDATTEQREERRYLVQEREVRLTAQRILATHLHPGPDTNQPVTTFWPNTSLDLTGATLIDFDLGYCHLHTARFSGAWFVGPTCFGEAQFAGDAEFSEAQFGEDVLFIATKFARYAGFSGTRFAGDAVFRTSTFAGSAGFADVQFAGGVGFDEAQFAEQAWFLAAHFAGYAGFNRVRFAGDAVFAKAQFVEDAEFREVQFAGPAWFGEAQFAWSAWFERTEFTEGVGFNNIALDEYPLDQQAWCWVRVDVPDTSVWPAGWTVQPADGHRPPGQDDGRWGHLVYTPPDTSTGIDGPVPDAGDGRATGDTPASPECTEEPSE